MTRGDVRTAVAAAAACGLGSVALAPVFASGAWIPPVAATVLVVLLSGLLLRWAGPALWRSMTGNPPSSRVSASGVPLVPLGQLAAVAWLLEAMYAPERLLGGLLPTPSGLRRLGEVLSDGTVELQQQVAPALALRGLLALTVVLVGLVAVAVDLLAVAGRQAALAGLGLLVLYCVPVSTLTGGIGLLPVAAPAAGLALLLWADQDRRLARRERGPRRWGTGAAAAVRIGVLAVVAGLVIGALVPTFAESRFNQTRGSGTGTGASTGTSLDPSATLKGQLTLPSPVDLLRVSSSVPDPGYLRAVALDQYDPVRGWYTDNLDPEEVVSGNPSLAPLPPRQTGRAVTATIRVLGHDDRYLPLLYSPQQVSVRGSDAASWRYDQDTGTVFSTSTTTKGRTYTETAEEPAPSTALLQQASDITGPSAVVRRNTRLPGLDPSVTQLVTSLVGQASSPYERVRAVYDYFTDPRNGFTYSLSTQPGTSNDDLVNFLTGRTGYCEQYAGAMAVMVRAAGVPARVALGYTAGRRQPDGSRLITSSDAHAWVEVWFTGLGWVPFDPTPISSERAEQLPWAPRPVPQEASPTAPGTTATPSTTPRNANPRNLDPDVPYVPLALPQQTAGWVRPVAIGLPVLLVVAGLLVAPALLRAGQRRRRVAAGNAPALWDELAATARDLRVRLHPALTARQTARQLAEVVSVGEPDRSAVDGIRRLALAEESASYAAPSADAGRDPSLETALRAARHGLLDAVPRRVRLRALLWPASLVDGVRAGLRALLPGSGRDMGAPTTAAQPPRPPDRDLVGSGRR
jgi:transglutaminase-like putative cysteine protease